MKPGKPTPPQDPSEEISALIETLHQTGHRLEELTAGEVDTVTDHDGRTFMLRHTQEQLRDSEVARQAAILNALPAHIALLDSQGKIISVSEAWRHFADVNALQCAKYGIGVNYLAICDNARGDDAAEAHQAAAGIRSVLAGAANSFSLEYPCHSPGEQRWFRMTVTPLSADRPHGVVIMHMNVTAERQSEKNLRESELKFRQMAENIRDVISLRSADGKYLLYISPAYEEIWGRSCESLYANPESWIEAIHPDDLASTGKEIGKIMPPGMTETKYRIMRPDGKIRWIESRGFPVRDDTGAVVRVASVAKDITEHKQDEQKFKDLLESAPDAMVIIGRDADIVLINAQAVNLFGWRREELLGQKVDMLVPERFRSRHPENRNGFFAQPHARLMGAGMDLFGLRKDGSEFPVEISLSPLETNEGTLAITTIRDISERKRAEQSLRESERRFSDMLGNMQLVSLMLDCAGRITYCNNYLLNLTGWLHEEVIGRNWFEMFIPPENTSLNNDLAALLDNIPAAWHHENEILTRTGQRRLIRWNNTVLKSGLGKVIGAASIGEDITERKEAQDKIVQLSRIYAVLSGINSLIVRVRDRDELFKEACRVAVETGGFRMAMIGIIDRSTMKIVPVATAGKNEELVTAIKSILSSDELASTTMVARAIREKRAIVSNDSQSDPQVLFGNKYAKSGIRSIVILPLIVSDEAAGALALYADEIEFFQDGEMKLLKELAGDIAYAIDHIEKQEQLDYLAYYDPLTGLANRRLFLERVALHMRNAASSGHKLALFLTDLERFRNINHSLGREAGDELLRQVAQWLTRTTGDGNLVARVGTDVFAVVLPEVREGGDLTRMLTKMIGAFLEHPFQLTGGTFRIAARGGAALFPDDGTNAEMVFKNAEAALKNAKARGERGLFYTQAMNEAVAGKLTLENQLRQALDNGEFVLHYQPKVNLASGKLTGAEALIRWNDPRTGLVPPNRFIPILEETGMIYDVGRWALRQATKDYLRWRAAGLPAVRIAVNVSPLQLRNSDFINEVQQAISIDSQAAAGLELEITESVVMEGVEHNIATLQAIRALGVTIAIDDFGTGFSSLSYLSKLPVDTLKIDRSFIIDMTAGPEGLALVSTIINLAHALKCKVVAEGVETEEQARLLRVVNCDEMQGYLFSKPVPSDIFETRFLAPPSTG